jgi:DNA-directed RNA polymerase subunit M/transcription elongation factor TFIIS
MPRMRCPGCRRILKIDEANRGNVVACPMCARRFAVPRSAKDDEPVEEQPAHYGVLEDTTPRGPIPLPLGEDEEEKDEGRPVYRRRNRKRREQMATFMEDYHVGKVLLLGSAGVWLVLLGLALIHPIFAIGLFVGGFVLVTAARIWSMVVAFNEEDVFGCLMLLSPYYFLFSLFNLEDRSPLILAGIGFLYLLTGLAVLSVFHGRI